MSEWPRVASRGSSNGSDYIAWAKRRLGVRYNLARSGMPRFELERLRAAAADLLAVEPHEDGWPPLLERIAARYGVSPERVVTTHGCSMANHLVFAALLAPGDEALIETPTYEPLVRVAEYLHARVVSVPRREELRWAVDPDDVRRALTPRTKLVVLSNLHNPTGALLEGAVIAAVARAADAVGVHVLIDEVYLEFLHADGVQSAASTAPNIIATRSLTKAFGLDALRVGWILAPPDIAEKIRRLNDIFSVTTAHPSERLAALALDRADELLESARSLLAANLKTVDAFVHDHPRLSWIPPRAGTVGFVRVEGVDTAVLAERLEREFETAIVPGRFFAAPEHVRIGWALDPSSLAEGLVRLRRALA